MNEFDREPRERREVDSDEGRGPEQGSAVPALRRAPGSSTPARPREMQANDGEDTLHQYIRSIAAIPVLSREQTYELARAMEAEELAFRGAMVAISATARELVERWHERRRSGRVTAALSAHFRDGSGRDYGRKIDASLGKVEKLLAQRDALAHPRSRRAKSRLATIDAQVAQVLGAAGISFEVLLEIHRRFQEIAATGRKGPEAETRRRLGLGLPSTRANLARAKRALARLDETKQYFVTHNLKLVVKNAKRYRNMGVPYIDLIQEANLGLIRAVEKFDYRRGFKFSTYAVWWIEQALIRAVQNHSRTVRVPSHIWELQLRYRRVQQHLRQQLGRLPRREELAAALEVDLPALDRIVSSMKPIVSTQATLPGTDEFTLEDSLHDENAEGPVDSIDRFELGREVENLLVALDVRERQILEWRFGLDGEDPRTLAEIGHSIGLSRERVRQIESRALRRLSEANQVQRLLASLDLPVPELDEEDPEADASGPIPALLH
jgi:RNA polymerase sigma factor (sigma-70 family)